MARKTRHAVLGVLSIEDASGYGIRKFLEASVRHFWSESFGQIYPILNALEAEGSVASREDPSGGRRRRMYSITDKGRVELRSWLNDSTSELRHDRNELLLKLFFCDEQSVSNLLVQIRELRTRLETRLAEYRSITDELTHRASSEPGYRYWVATLEYGRVSAEAHIEWCDATLRSLEDPRRPGASPGEDGVSRHAI